jgi:phytoene dehydrogenase-like protein
MKKVVLISIAGVLSFVLSTADIYLAMPSLAPELVDSTRIQLDSLGLTPRESDASVTHAVSGSSAPDIDADTSSAPAQAGQADSLHTASSESIPSINPILSDSLRHTRELLAVFRADKAALSRQIADLKQALDERASQQFDTSELGKSLGKLEDKQLSNILAGLDLSVVEMLYAEASGRERSRLLQHLPPDRAARFVHQLVNIPVTANEMPTQDPLRDGGDDSQLSN